MLGINTELDKYPWKVKIKEKTEAWEKEHQRRISWKEYQILHNFKETNYKVKASAWKMLDYAHPAWAPIDYSQHGKNMEKNK